MIAKCGTRVAGSLVIGLCVASAVSGGGSLFVTFTGAPIKRLDSETYELLGQIGESHCCNTPMIGLDGIDPYRRYLWVGGKIRDLNFNEMSSTDVTVSVNTNFDPISNSYWKFTWRNGTLTRETYDRENITSRTEADFSEQSGYPHQVVVASENNVFFVVDKTISTLDDAIFEFPVTVAEPYLRTVKDGFLYFAYRPSSTDWHNIYRIRTDGTGFEELASDIPYLSNFDVDAESETIFFKRMLSADSTSELIQDLFAIGFGETTPITICKMCATDVVFVADDEWFLPGDTDLDNDIDITDFNALASNFNPKLERDGPVWAYKTVRQGDFNGDWLVDITDFTVLADNFAPSGYPGPYDGMGVSDVPEPSPLVLALLAAILVGVSRRLSKNNCD